MNEMKPLGDGPLPPAIAELLRSAEGEIPPDAEDKQARILAAGAATLAAAPAPRAAKSGVWRKLPWAGFVAAVAVLAVVQAGRSNRGPADAGIAERHVAPAPRAIDTTESNAAPPQQPTPDIAPSVRIDELPSAPSADPNVRPRPLAERSRRVATSNLEDELAMIDSARSALASGAPARALAQVSSYRATFREPHFSAEADALEVQALSNLGRHAEARSKANAFERAHPSSPYMQRVRSAVGERD